jgi:hypothetical protein
MVRRWFGPRPVYIADPFVGRHGSCGCCGCAGLTEESDLVRYAAYRNGLRLKLTIAGVPDSFSMYLDDTYPIYLTEATGMSQYNGTWYLDIVRSQYGCIFSAADFDLFDVAYVATDPDFYPDGETYTQRVRIGVGIGQTGFRLGSVLGLIDHYSPDYEFGAGTIISPAGHPMLGLAFEPDDPAYLTGGALLADVIDAVSVLVESRSTGLRPNQLTDTITGNLRFYISDALGNQNPIGPPLTSSDWVGTDTFWDFGASEFKIAGTFSLEIERL